MCPGADRTATLRRIYEEVLEIEGSTKPTAFFALGGSSLLVVLVLELLGERGSASRFPRRTSTASPHVITVKNPQVPSLRGAGLQPSRRANLPKKLQRLFPNESGGERRFIDPDSPDFPDHPGVESVFVAASGDPHTELGIDVEQEKEPP